MTHQYSLLRRSLFVGASILGLSMLSACATQPQTSSGVDPAFADGADEFAGDMGAAQLSSDPVFKRFAPAPSGRRTSVNYEVVDEALNMMTFSSGRSLRKRARRPEPRVGTRRTFGHTSAFRLEGNRIFFSQFDDETVASMSEYRKSLEEIGNKIELTTLKRDEQLAYWLNLHNMIVIEQIAINYPVKEPSKMRVGPNGETLHEAKLVTIEGVPLSLNDIRTNIVYRYWRDPVVMYGFFRGDIGGPSIQPFAFTPGNLKDRLNRSAKEFVNSLRGVRAGGGNVNVSPIYEEARAVYFPDWPGDLEAHLRKYALEDVTEILDKEDSYRVTRYETRVADLAGGEIRSNLNFNASPSGASVESVTIPPNMARMMREFNEKQFELQLKYGPRGRVIIEDIQTDDPDEPSEIQ